MANYHINRYWGSGEWIDVITRMTSVNATRVAHDIGKLTFSLPFTERFLSSIEVGQLLSLYRNERLQFDTHYILRDWRAVTGSDGLRLIECYAVDLNFLLDARIVAYPADSAQSKKSGKVDDLMKAVVHENLGAGAPFDRRLAGISVDTNLSLGKTVRKAFAWRNVKTVLQELADMTLTDDVNIYWDMHGAEIGKPRFSTYANCIGLDRRPSAGNPVLVGEQYGNLRSSSVEWIFSDEATAVYAGGQGQEDERIIKLAVDDKRIARAYPYGRIEHFKDARNEEEEGTIEEQANELLKERSPFVRISGELIETDGFRYDRDYKWGDLVKVEAYGQYVDCMISAVGLSVDAGDERIDARLEGVVK